MGLNSTLIMSNAPPHLYGRIMSIYMLTKRPTTGRPTSN